MKKTSVLTGLGLAAGLVSAADFPQAEMSNGLIRAKVFLPDAKNGFYRGTRFDWSGMVGSLEYQGHNFYGPWFDRVDPQVRDFIYAGREIVASPCSAATGPAEEFQSASSALGWEEAKPGGTFIKIGVGVLRKDAEGYAFAKFYEMVDPGKWTVKTHRDSVAFTHELTDLTTGYGYLYHKTVRVTKAKPELLLEHRLKNTGRRVLQTSVYNHNFLVLDRQPPGPDFAITVPYQIQSRRPPNPALAEIRGNQIVYLKPLADREVVQMGVQGFGESAKDYEIRLENRKVGAGLTITGNRPLANHALWSIRTVLSMEPFIAMRLEPGQEFTWKIAYLYHTLSPRPRNQGSGGWPGPGPSDAPRRFALVPPSIFF